MNRVTVRTEQTDSYPDGTTTTTKTERITERQGNGLWDAWFALVVGFSTFIAFVLVVRLLLSQGVPSAPPVPSSPEPTPLRGAKIL